MKQTTKVAVQCQECGKRFKTASLDPQCPKCHGVDVDVDYAPPAPRRAITVHPTHVAAIYGVPAIHAKAAPCAACEQEVRHA